MANPQKEDGFTSIAHEILESLAKKKIPLSDHEWKILMFLFRKTYGWKKTKDQISLSQFAEGTETRRAHASRAIQKLIQKNMVGSTQIGTTKDKKYFFQKDYEKWYVVPKQGLSIVVPKQGPKVVPKQVQGSPKVEQKVVPKQGPTIDTTKENPQNKQKIDENQVSLENILATMELDIKNYQATGLSNEWIKKVYIGLGVPEAQIDKALGKEF